MAAARPDPWFPFVRPNPGARLRLFCFPFAGGGASVFREWSDGLPIDVDVWATQLPGRETRYRQPAYVRMDRLVANLAAAVHPHLDRPFALFGHSMGSLVALELARELRRHDRPPAGLVVAGHAAPHRPPRRPPLHALLNAEFRDELRRLNGTPAAVLDNDELMQAVLPTVRADFALCETYIVRDEPPLDCPILALGGGDDPRVSAEDLEAWRTFTRDRFEVQILPGDHFFIQSHRPAVLAAVARFLEPLQSSESRTAEPLVWHDWSCHAPLGENDVHVWQARLDVDEERVRHWASMLVPEELARAERFHFRIDRQRYVVGRGVLRRMLGEYLGMRPTEVGLWYNSHGKPALTGESDRGGVKFNASHSGDLLFLAIAKGREVGVDVEHVRRLPDWRELAGRYFAPTELAELDTVPAPERERAFFQCWTRKEAYIKAQGLGMTLPLDQFAVSLAGEPARLVSTDHDPAQLSRWTLRDVSPGGDYAAAVVADGSGWDLWCGICPW
jgi:medium-chain acyl-[acyl-carrier-protein] hydrolase